MFSGCMFIDDGLCTANKKPAQEHAAVWVPDGDASTCMHCLKTKFTPINRRVGYLKIQVGDAS